MNDEFPAGVPQVLRPVRASEGPFRFEGPSLAESLQGRTVVFGGEILARMIMVSAELHPGMAVRSIHGVFARAARHDLPMEYETEAIHGGRNFGSDTITLRQEGRIAARAVVLVDAGEPDLVRHGPGMPSVPLPEASRRHDLGPVFPGSEQRVVGDADFRAARAVAMDPALNLWIRAPVAGAPQSVHQAVTAWNSVGMLIGTAMFPHASISQTEAHRSLSTGVLSHTISFHSAIDAGEWLLFSEESIHAGGGRCHGRGLVFSGDGRLVASFTQDALLRRMPQAGAASHDPRRAM